MGNPLDRSKWGVRNWISQFFRQDNQLRSTWNELPCNRIIRVNDLMLHRWSDSNGILPCNLIHFRKFLLPD